MSRHDLTANIAFMIFQQRGYTPGRHVEDWIAAEAIVAMCMAVLTALLPEATPPADEADPPATAPGPELATPTVAERAMQMLQDAVSAQGRKAVAGQLGYRSTSTVGKCLRGDRALGQALIEKILAAFGPQEQVRRAA